MDQKRQTKSYLTVIFQENNDEDEFLLDENARLLVNKTINESSSNAISHNKNHIKLIQKQALQEENKSYAVISAITLFVATIINFSLLLQAFLTPKKFTASEFRLSFILCCLIGSIIFIFSCILILHFFEKKFADLTPKIKITIYIMIATIAIYLIKLVFFAISLDKILIKNNISP
ncbi:hypothetical protein EDEG_00866 [Edhazardia aedis USNM 41457]|uniref:Uncharacterized protein n=1 Tax=Edhazardia aedis (strain USNM 41457) TaxID=1003232 RepID=J9DBA3_EDHAE|nr:hypothetical protein EDEG_00866 [Edhazardia aedis USNM 41457]|eukprot:EJW05031.1 hypothetical protein EDEG_00866 [Edhazardia aedis USNM 41457]